MAFDAFLKLDGIKGESQDAKHKNEIDINSFRFGLKQAGVQGTGGGGGAGKVQVRDMQLVKSVDAASPLLLVACANGTHIKEATLTVRKAGGQQLEYLKIKLTDVLISGFEPYGAGEVRSLTTMVTSAPGNSGTTAPGLASLQTSVLSPGDPLPLENLSLNFAKIEFSYQQQGPDGGAQGGPIIGGWDVKQNKKI